MKKDFSDYYATERDALEYQLKVILFAILLYACFAAYVVGAISLGWMLVLSSVLVTRWMIAFHELLHLRAANELDLFTRLSPLPFAPFNIGYREYRSIHAGHHSDTATENDPDAFHIMGGHMKALFGGITLHEQQIVRYVRRHGLSRELAVMIVLRFSLFSGLFVLAPMAFLWWWLVLRITYVINDFVFFHLVHYRGGGYGSFSLPLPAVIRYPAMLIYGFDVVYATMHHDIHHEQQMVAARHLQQVATLMGRQE